MTRTIKMSNEMYQKLGRFGNRDESWNDVLARLVKHVDEEEALEDRDNRTTTHSQEETSTDSPLERLDDGTVVRHRYERGEYSGDKVTAIVRGGRLEVEGDPGPEGKPNLDTRSPSGAAKEADRQKRGEDAASAHNGWIWWEFKDEDDNWLPIDVLRE